MAKRIKYHIGDIILVPVCDMEGWLPARILRQYKATALIEVYGSDIIMESSGFNKEKMFSQKPILTMWCYDAVIKTGEWTIVGNEPVIQYEDIYFWTKDNSLGYILLKGDENGKGEFTGIAISMEEIKNYNPYGITNEFALPEDLAKIINSK
ncbi:hypothetical protein GZH47_10770 [Paenibacillus rhizovicinus]|uniref:Uncharacterized protein n=1 Tax=Paenibacillus rhizovicinus TaxID=2704463 RepID=A0A6C0NYU7_9BACL|nr:hypothetical protein [Paenibacillus rhizovicinus]QHW31291.1 hypothetical protein GZH47_10770 [Paenibacillus rhizovicinus]